ncbi:uncharacterized protein LOC123273870 [Cotesia glomerata]|uniref:uncharacterized protein LOC123273870 n=1 Tax=Cotesia glomerata TaxID=32391 RepID=UPI001D0106AA|nr:uncharacterized protein LOC123273870 [Cotesia glomerata]
MTPKALAKKKKSVQNRQRCQYTPEDLENAVNSIRNSELSMNKASQTYNIPKATLSSKVKHNHAVHCKLGRSTILTTDEEDKIKNLILNKAKLGFPMCREDVKNAVQKVLKEMKRDNPFIDDRPGCKWMELFLNRHAEISLRNSEVLSKARACVTEEGIREWFTGLQNHIEIDLGLQEFFKSPERIINLDELGMSLCPKTGKVLGPKGEKNLYRIATGIEKQSISVLCSFSADGNSFDPMIIYAYKKMPLDIANSLPKGFAIGRSDTGWINSANFYEYIANVLYPRLIERGTKFPVLILCDGHKLHINMDLHRFCVDKQIILYCLVPNSTHILQPCDIGIFYPLKLSGKKW